MNVGELLVKIGATTRDLKRGVKEAEWELEKLPDEKVIKIKIDKDRDIVFGLNNLGKTKGLLEVIMTAAPLAAAALNSALGAAGGLASMLASATTGVGAFGAVSVAVLNDVFDAQKDIEKANEDMAKASTAEEQQTAVENLAKAYRGLDQSQLAALASLQKFRGFWKDFQGQFNGPIVTAFSLALDGLQSILTELGPTIKVAGNAIVGVIKGMNDATKNSDFKAFFDWLKSTAGQSITNFGKISINILQGVLNMMVAFQPVSEAMQGGLVGMTQAFLEWTQSLGKSESFKQFLDFVISAGPQFLTFIKLMVIALMDLINALAPLGNLMIRVINVIVAFFNAIMGIGKSAQVATARINDLTNAVKELLGIQTSSTSTQTDAAYDLDKAYQDIIDSVGGVGDGLKDAGKDAKKFLASFDEVYQIPDALDKMGGAIPQPKPPTIPTIPTPQAPSSGNNGGDAGGWIDKLLEKIKQIPPVIPLPTFNWPSPPAVVTDALQAIIDKINAFKLSMADPATAFTMMMGGIMTAISTLNPTILLGIDAITYALSGIVIQTPITSAAFATMLNDMQANLNAYRPYLTYGLGLVTLAMQVVQQQTPVTSTAFNLMLNTMQVDLNAFQPYISWGLALIGLSMSDLSPIMDKLNIDWHAALDYMQSQVNAYQPYISWQFTLIGLAITTLIDTANSAVSPWRAAWMALHEVAKAIAEPIISLFESIGKAYQRLMQTLEQPITIPSIKLPSIEAPKIATDITDALKSIDYGKVLSDAWKKPFDAISTNPISTYFGNHPENGAIPGSGAAIGAAGAAASKAGTAIKAIEEWMQSIGQSGSIPAFATGGIVGSDQIVRVGENNKKEAIIPLESGAMNPFADAIASRLGGQSGDGSGSVVIEIKGNIYGGPSGIKELARQINQALKLESGRGSNA